MPWGCNQFGILAALMIATGSADVACPSGANTIVASIGGNNTGFLAGTISNDQWVPTADGVLAILFGATPPTALSIFLQTIQSGVLDTYQVAPAAMLANATLLLPLALLGPSSRATWQGPQQPQISATPTAQAITVKFVGTRAIFRLAIGGP